MKKAVIETSLTHIFDGIERLRNTFPGKTFAIDGRLVGDIGEVIAAMDYDIKLYKNQKARHDGITGDGRRVQIKATFKDSLTFKTKPDYYLGLKLLKNGGYKEVFNGPGEIIFKHYKHRKGIGKTLLSFPICKLERLSDSIPMSKRIKRKQMGSGLHI